MIERRNHTMLHPPASPYSHVVADERYLFLSGVVAADIPGGSALLGDIRAETRLVLSTIRDVLRRHGSALDDVLRVDIHLRDLAEIEAMDEVYRGFFGVHLPARTCTGVSALWGNCRVEITVQARRRR